jgi:hypothetical protein
VVGAVSAGEILRAQQRIGAVGLWAKVTPNESPVGVGPVENCGLVGLVLVVRTDLPPLVVSVATYPAFTSPL